MDSFGRNFRVTIFGESHGKSLGVVVDGAPAGMPLSAEDFTADIGRRRSGAEGTTPRTESDIPDIISGVYDGRTTGAAIAIVFGNGDIRSGDYSQLADHPRPSHADMAAQRKYGGFNDPRGGGHFSGRLTLGLVAAGVIAKKMLDSVVFTTRITRIGGSDNPDEFDAIIKEASRAGDSVGGVIECVVTGIPAGTGAPFFDSVESIAAHLLFSIPAVKGVEFGAGFSVADRLGSRNNDMILNREGLTLTNNDGGVNGGIANGNPIVVRAAVKPTPSISLAQETYNLKEDKVAPLLISGRHDACIALRAAVVVESAMAIALADLLH